MGSHQVLMDYQVKYGGPKLCRRVHAIIVKAWESETIPNEWRDSNIVTIFKKGNRADCKNYRGISLLAVIGKIFARIILQRLVQHISETILPKTQCGFRRDRSTIDMIFAARQIQEKCREQNIGLYLIFFDLTKAFDTVSREALWKLLERYGCPPKFINLIRLFHDHIRGQVVLGKSTSKFVPISNGVKQGCVLAPSLFGIFLTAVIQEAYKDRDEGIYIRYRTDGKLFNIARLRAN